MGIIISFIKQSFPPEPKYTVDSIPDLSGKVMIVTGANSGIGYETAKALLLHNAKVYVASRSPEKSRTAIEKLRDATNKEAVFLKLDLADLKAIKAATDEFYKHESELHVLFNNAGVMFPPIDQLTADGYDLQFGTNVLGHYYFTMLLLPGLRAGAKTSGNGKARVVTTSSSGHMFGNLNFSTFKDGPARKRSNAINLYFQSKYGNVVFATELARRCGDQGIVSTSLNPGNLNTNLFRHFPYILRKIINWTVFDARYGALTQLYAGTSPEGTGFNGKYLVPWGQIGQPRVDSQDPQVGVELWAWLEEQIKGA